MIICLIDDCEKPVHLRGWCSMHYTRNYRYGDPLIASSPTSRRGRARTKTAQARFWEKVDKNGPIPEHRSDLGPCWLWTGFRDRDGYGMFRLDGKQRRAHAVSLEFATGDLLGSLFALHHCDNPPCVNDSHLFAGTNLDNMRDMVDKGRWRSGRWADRSA